MEQEASPLVGEIHVGSNNEVASNQPKVSKVAVPVKAELHTSACRVEEHPLHDGPAEAGSIEAHGGRLPDGQSHGWPVLNLSGSGSRLSGD